MERLTIAERALLANVRQMEQYRREFLLGRGHWQRLELRRRPQSPRRLLRRQRSGRVCRRRRRRLRPGRRLRRRRLRAGLRLHGRRGRPAGRRLHGPAADGADHPQPILEHRVARRQRRAAAGRARRRAASTASRSTWRGRPLQRAEPTAQLRGDQYQNRASTISKCSIGMPPDLDLVVSDPMLDQFNLLDPKLAELQMRRDRSAERCCARANVAPAAEARGRGAGSGRAGCVRRRVARRAVGGATRGAGGQGGGDLGRVARAVGDRRGRLSQDGRSDSRAARRARKACRARRRTGNGAQRRPVERREPERTGGRAEARPRRVDQAV